MRRLHRIYTFSLFGALGGLIGSLLHQHLVLPTLSEPLSLVARYSYLALLGVTVGVPIGFFPGLSEGLGNYSFAGALRSGIIGGFWGGAGGLLALPLAEFIHIQLGGGFKGRVSALVLLGISVAISEWINGGARLWYGLLGGLSGGVAAGAVLEYLLSRESTHNISGILALVIIGFSIGFFISLIINVLSEAWLEGLSGSKVDGQVFFLSKFREPHEAYIGSDKKGSVFIWIPDAQPRHACITITATGTRIRHIADSGETCVDGSPIKERMLRDGDVIEIGHSQFRYREKRTSKLGSVSPVSSKLTQV